MAFLILTFFSGLSLSQQKIEYKKPVYESRNNWGLGFVYSENGFGISAGKYLTLSNSIDFNANILVSGVTDSREIERSDIYGNTVVLGKINRVFMAPLSIGLIMELFKGDLEGDFKPFLNLGVAPTLVMFNPYNKNFFSAIGYTSTKFAVGPYLGIGMSFQQSKSMALNVNISYYYLPLIDGGVESIENNSINNVGGVQLLFGLNFLK
ncbi:MAG TPA: hypothetical protein PKD83_00950 [Ignavibacteria bacterium]|nr:hypothetical protein [Ignavibacteria bacterium]